MEHEEGSQGGCNDTAQMRQMRLGLSHETPGSTTASNVTVEFLVHHNIHKWLGITKMQLNKVLKGKRRG